MTTHETSDRAVNDGLDLQGEKVFRSFVTHSPIGVIIMDEVGNIREWNPAAECLSMVSRDEAIGQPIWDIMVRFVSPDKRTPQTQQRLKSSILDALRTGKPAFAGPAEYRLWRADGRSIVTRQTVFPIETAIGYRFGSLIEDITEQKRAEVALRQSERNYREIFNATAEALFIHDETGRVIDVNDAMCAMFGCDRETALRAPAELRTLGTAPYTAAVVAEKVRLAIEKGPQCFEWRSRRLSGELFWSEVSLRACEIGGQPRVIASVRDISARKQIEEAMRRQERRLALAVSATSDAIWEWNLATGATYYSPRWYEMLGYANEQFAMTLETFRELCHPDDFQPTMDRIFAVLSQPGSQGYEAEFRMRNRDGSWSWILGRGNVIERDQDGRPLVVSGTNADISERKRAEEKLQLMESQLAHVARLSALGEMVAGIAHELNQPLYSLQNIAKACGNVLAHPATANLQELREWCNEMSLAAARAGAIVKQMRGFARRAPPARDPAWLHEIIAESISLTAYHARQHRTLLKSVAPVPALQVDVHRVQIVQVLVNLLQNAAEAMDEADCPRREAMVSVRRDAGFVEVSVTDTGPGLGNDVLARAFEPFFTTKPEGLGVGLAICTTIVEAHGGRLWAENRPEGGAAFHFTLPVSREGQGP